jgi:hypothetical protein
LIVELLVVPKLYWTSGTLSAIVWFLGPVSILKTGRAFAFFSLSSSNRNRGKAFAALSIKNHRTQPP